MTWGVKLLPKEGFGGAHDFESKTKQHRELGGAARPGGQRKRTVGGARGGNGGRSDLGSKIKATRRAWGITLRGGEMKAEGVARGRGGKLTWGVKLK